MECGENSRRAFLKQISAAGALALSPPPEVLARVPEALGSLRPQASAAPESPRAASRADRMAWWHQARFGMFIH
jgi:hypothetical protein